jgi:hypothetical protein
MMQISHLPEGNNIARRGKLILRDRHGQSLLSERMRARNAPNSKDSMVTCPRVNPRYGDDDRAYTGGKIAFVFNKPVKR